MTQKLARVSLTLPTELLTELDGAIQSQRYASRSEAIRDSIQDFLADYRWRKGLAGKLLGAILVLYDHEVRGLGDKLIDIQHASADVIKSVQHLHVDEKNCLEVLICEGRAKKVRELVERMSTLRGVKQAKLVVV
ncbi:MAG: nickel-responsive transcriptional regulator NikR [Candidatus Hadarchaeota archaeon]